MLARKEINFKLLNLLGPVETYAWEPEAMIIAIHEKRRRRLRKNATSLNNYDDIFVLTKGKELSHFISQLTLSTFEDYACHLAFYEPDGHWVSLHVHIQKNEFKVFILDSLGGYDSSGRVNQDDIDRIIRLISASVNPVLANHLQIYINRIKLQHDSYNCSRFTLHHIYTVSPRQIFHDLSNGLIQPNINDIIEIKLWNIPKNMLNLCKPMQSFTDINLLASIHEKDSKNLASLIKTIKKHKKFNPDKKKYENNYIEHKKNNYTNHIRLFMEREPPENKLQFLFSQRNAMHFTALDFADILQQINDFTFWDKIKSSGEDIHIIEVFRDYTEKYLECETLLKNKLSSLAHNYIVWQSSRLDNLHAYELCTILYKLLLTKQSIITINDKFSLFLSEKLRNNLDKINSLPEKEFQNFIQHPDIDNYLISLRDVIYILNKIQEDKRIDFLITHAESIFSRLKNNKYAYDLILSTLPHEAHSSFMCAPIIFNIKTAKQLANVLSIHFTKHERLLFAIENRHAIKNMPELIEIIWLLPKSQRLELIKQCSQIVKNTNDFQSLSEILPESNQSELIRIFPNININKEKNSAYENPSSFFSTNSKKKELANLNSFAQKAPCSLF